LHRDLVEDLARRRNASSKRESGIGFKGHHTLRRTGGRLMWQEGVPIETVASIMGHETTEMTLRYIGVNLDDQAKAFQTVRDARIQRAKSVEIVPLSQSPGV
jgi:integrase